jgi:hypothetical protein
MTNNNERLQMMKDYLASQQDVVVELPPVVSFIGSVKKITRFNGYRLGNVRFIEGKATISRDKLHLLQTMYPNLIVHGTTTTIKDGAR